MHKLQRGGTALFYRPVRREGNQKSKKCVILEAVVSYKALFGFTALLRHQLPKLPFAFKRAAWQAKPG